MVNSLHSQGIDRPAPELRIEATAPDGQIEAVTLPSARFVLGVQWHPEYRPRKSSFLGAILGLLESLRAAAAGFRLQVRAA